MTEFFHFYFIDKVNLRTTYFTWYFCFCRIRYARNSDTLKNSVLTSPPPHRFTLAWSHACSYSLGFLLSVDHPVAVVCGWRAAPHCVVRPRFALHSVALLLGLSASQLDAFREKLFTEEQRCRLSIKWVARGYAMLVSAPLHMSHMTYERYDGHLPVSSFRKTNLFLQCKNVFKFLKLRLIFWINFFKDIL